MGFIVSIKNWREYMLCKEIDSLSPANWWGKGTQGLTDFLKRSQIYFLFNFSMKFLSVGNQWYVLKDPID